MGVIGSTPACGLLTIPEAVLWEVAGFLTHAESERSRSAPLPGPPAWGRRGSDQPAQAAPTVMRAEGFRTFWPIALRCLMARHLLPHPPSVIPQCIAYVKPPPGGCYWQAGGRAGWGIGVWGKKYGRGVIDEKNLKDNFGRFFDDSFGNCKLRISFAFLKSTFSGGTSRVRQQISFVHFKNS